MQFPFITKELNRIAIQQALSQDPFKYSQHESIQIKFLNFH